MATCDFRDQLSSSDPVEAPGGHSHGLDGHSHSHDGGHDHESEAYALLEHGHTHEHLDNAGERKILAQWRS